MTSCLNKSYSLVTSKYASLKRNYFAKDKEYKPSLENPEININNIRNVLLKRIKNYIDSKLKTIISINANTSTNTNYDYDNTLFVILPYFNYCNGINRYKLFVEFVERNITTKNIKLVIIEAYESGKSPQLEDDSIVKKVYKYLKYETKDLLWLKENLINIAIKNLPDEWQFVAWIDADISFMNTNWPTDTINKLKESCDICQLFEVAINYGPEPNREIIKVDKGFCYMYHKSGKPYNKNSKYGFWHPGYAWACNKKAFTRMNGLIDFGILGSGDRHMCLSLIGLSHESAPGNISKNYLNKLKEFENRCITSNLKTGFIQGIIFHYWHGNLKDRKYADRWTILTKNRFDPNIDIIQDESGLYQLTESGKRLNDHLRNYFVERNEDNNLIEL